MDLTAKKVLVNLFYYSLAFLIVLFSVLFMVLIGTKTLATYQMIIYYIWAGIAIAVVVFEVFASMRNRYKLVVGLIIYGLTFLCLLVGFIVYAALQTNGIIPAASLDVFSVLIYFSLAISIALITLFVLGTHMAKLAEARE